MDRPSVVCDLVSRDPFAAGADLAATGPTVDVLVTGWGTPILGPETLTQLPA